MADLMRLTVFECLLQEERRLNDRSMVMLQSIEPFHHAFCLLYLPTYLPPYLGSSLLVQLL